VEKFSGFLLAKRLRTLIFKEKKLKALQLTLESSKKFFVTADFDGKG